MKTLGTHNYYVYILTNYLKERLYIGVTDNLERRLQEHKNDAQTEKKAFAGKYNCYYLVYWERFQYISDAIKREKELKGWARNKKIGLIEEFNPEWKFLNESLYP
jgi:putative endonuclease